MRIFTLTLLLLSGVAHANETGQTLLAPFKQELKQALMAGLEQGPQAALTVCQQQAPEIAQRHSVNGVLMGRSSDKLRNPNNQPPDWVAPILKQFQSGDLSVVTVALDPQTQGYVEPIMIGPPCLTCHGENIAPEIQQSLAEYYPSDQATGYQLGQWRGAFWVSYPTE
ncbi:DUF3365 domain-containing protein [Ferrimonas balearica]|uniref:Tll0287-like domain-containing protein n=1 Tax=Ferrimonas balearica TaxID=44012 RepID=UPI001C99CA93|nr:DUF3365 domain-containing protein [Ferrimonas balearica]MBY5921191.1 DUF3365 domain-containing protein [Ferrimonas balearica]MBY5996124.1 DUF3365 domain-containing protein [Ferrimonas balearica]